MPMTAFDTSDLAARLGATARGRAARVRALTSAEDAGPDAIVVATDADAAARALAHGPAALVVARGVELDDAAGCAVLEVDDPRLALAHLSQLFDRRPAPASGVAPSAVIADDARLGAGVAVGPASVVAAGASVGDDTRIGASCSIGEGVRIGRGCRLFPGVVLYDGVVVGDRVTLHAGTVIGADGFGYAAGPRGAVKIHHLGSVEIGDDVEIGANTAVDRGTLGATRIGARTKIDNHCQIGHNVTIGSDCLIAGMTGIAGSTTLGDGVVLGGYVAVADHLVIGDGARLAGRSGVTKDVPAGETWAGFPAQPYRRWVRGLYLQGRLERIWAVVKGRDADR